MSGPPPGVLQRRWRAAIFQLDRLGDFVLAVSTVRTLLATWGETDCLLVLSDAAAPLAAREFPRTPRIVLPPSAPSITRNLVPLWVRARPVFRGQVFDQVVCLSHHRDVYKETALSWLATARTDRLTRTTYPKSASDPWCLELLAHRQLASTALGRTLTLEEIVPQFSSIASTRGADLLVCPFASEPIRGLPEALLLAASISWRARSLAAIVLSGGAGDEPRLQQLAALLRERRLDPVTVAAADSFDGFLARVATAGTVLAVESGPAHLAIALDKPAVILLGGGRPGLCLPWRRSSRQVILQHVVPCYGCGWRCAQAEPYCLTRISAADLAAVLSAL